MIVKWFDKKRNLNLNFNIEIVLNIVGGTVGWFYFVFFFYIDKFRKFSFILTGLMGGSKISIYQYLSFVDEVFKWEINKNKKKQSNICSVKWRIRYARIVCYNVTFIRAPFIFNYYQILLVNTALICTHFVCT